MGGNCSALQTCRGSWRAASCLVGSIGSFVAYYFEAAASAPGGVLVVFSINQYRHSHEDRR